jgi:hypothetical protein
MFHIITMIIIMNAGVGGLQHLIVWNRRRHGKEQARRYWKVGVLSTRMQKKQKFRAMLPKENKAINRLVEGLVLLPLYMSLHF